MIIKSKHPYVWPHLGFALAAGDNEIDESDIPLAAHGKLEHLSKGGTLTTSEEVVDDDGNKSSRAVTRKVPGPISGYAPSAAFVNAAEKHNPKRAAARLPKVATLKTLAAAERPVELEPEEDDDEGLDVELTEEALGKLSFKDLQLVAAKAEVDVDGLTAKKQIVDKLLAHAARE